MPASTPSSARPDASDTLLQSLQGLLFHMQAAHDLLPDRPADARRALALALESGDTAVARTLAQARGAEAGAARHLRANRQRLLGLTPDQQLRVLREALGQALRHADGKHIGVEVVWRQGAWMISVRPRR